MELSNVISAATRALLQKPMPPESIKKHPTKMYLSTIKAIYVTERLNDVFGIGGWNFEHEIIGDSPDYVTVKGKIIVKNAEYSLETLFQYGGHVKTGKGTEPADGYKSAITDAISKCASYLEIGIDVFKGNPGVTIPVVMKITKAQIKDLQALQKQKELKPKILKVGSKRSLGLKT
jgi:Uncharacterized protein conserved in bacteria